MHFLVDIILWVCYINNRERLLEWEPPTRAYATASLSTKDDDMTTLAAKGYTTDGVAVYLWAYGGYEYAVEVKKDTFTDTECLDCTYEEAVNKFKERAINGLTMY